MVSIVAEGLNRWEYEWLALSPKSNVEQHRWRESSYVFQVDQYKYFEVSEYKLTDFVSAVFSG